MDQCITPKPVNYSQGPTFQIISACIPSVSPETEILLIFFKLKSCLDSPVIFNGKFGRLMRCLRARY